MKTLVVLAVLVAVSFAELCTTPPQWTGDLYEAAEVLRGGGGLNVEHIMRGARVEYDAIGRRIHIHSFTDVGTPFPDRGRREYHDRTTIYYESTFVKVYNVINDECVIEERKGSFKALGVPEDAEYRGTTYIGGGKGLFGDGVGVDVYSARRGDSDGDEGFYYGTWAPVGTDYCIPVTESFYLFEGRFGRGEAYTGHMTFYNITTGIDSADFSVPPECYFATKKRIL